MPSRHVQGDGKAVDISRINGNKLSLSYSSNATVKAIVKAMQMEYENYSHCRENFGPYLKKKLGNDHVIAGHGDHIYFSVNWVFMMKMIFVFGFLLLSSCGTITGDLQKALAFGKIKELNQLSEGVDKQLLLRIYEAPLHQDGCFSETHGICQYQYFISVSTFYENPETNIFRIKTNGEIVNIAWIEESEIDTARIRLTINEFTKSALANNTTLKNEKKIVQLIVDANRIIESIMF